MPAELERAVRAIEEDIAFGRLQPQQRLIEDELMARFSLTRHAAREVLAWLDRLGLIERRRNVGAVVRSFSAQQMRELFALRSLLECEAARRIPLPLNESQLKPLQVLQQRHDKAVKAGDAPAAFHADLAFHETLFGLVEDVTLQSAIAEYARQTNAMRFSALFSPGHRERAGQEHAALIEALRKGQRKALVALCRAHLLPFSAA